MNVGFAALVVILIVGGLLLHIGIQATDSIGSNSIAQNVVVDPSSITASDSKPDYPASNANDDSTASYWESLPVTATYFVTDNSTHSLATKVSTNTVEFVGTDDRVVIQQAINATYDLGGGTVYLDADNFQINATDIPLLLRSNVYLKGSGQSLTTLEAIGIAPFYKPVLRNENYFTTTNDGKDHNITLSDFRMDMNTDGAAEGTSTVKWGGLLLLQVDNVVTKRLGFYDGYRNCVIYGGETRDEPEDYSYNLYAEDLVFDNCGTGDRINSSSSLEAIALHGWQHVTIKNITITEAGGAGLSTNAFTDQGGNPRKSVVNVTIDGFYIDGNLEETSGAAGIRVGDNSTDIVIKNGIIKNFKGHGISANKDVHNYSVVGFTVENVWLEHNALLAGSGDVMQLRLNTAKNVLIRNVTAIDSPSVGTSFGRDGIQISTSENVVVEDSYAYNNTRSGISINLGGNNITISGGAYFNNGQHPGDSDGMGIQINGYNAPATHNITIIDVDAFDNQTVKTQLYGARMFSNTGNTVANVTFDGYDFANNKNGYFTKSGSGTIENIYLQGEVTHSGSTVTTVTHNWAVSTPTLGNITLIPLDPLGNVNTYEAINNTSTTFQIQTDVVPDNPIRFQWKVRVL